MTIPTGKEVWKTFNVFEQQYSDDLGGGARRVESNFQVPLIFSLSKDNLSWLNGVSLNNGNSNKGQRVNYLRQI